MSEVSTLPSTFAEDVVNYTKAGWSGMEVWLTKLETHLESHSLGDTRKLLADHQLSLAAASYQGGLLLAQGQQRQAHYDDFRRRLDLCQQLAIGTLLVVADFAASVSVADLRSVIASLKQAAQWAAGFDVRLALEFRASARFCSSLETAIELVRQCGEPNVGVNLDVFHYYAGPSKFEDLDRLTPSNLAFVQVADVAGIPRELATDSDRVLPGDGDFRLAPIINRLRSLPYEGWISLELMNPTLWRANPVSLAEIGLSAVRRLLHD